MKVSETLNTIIKRKQNGHVKKQVNKSDEKKNSGSSAVKNVKEEKRDSISSTDSRRGRTSFSRRQSQGRSETPANHARDEASVSPTRRHRSRLDYDKPWLLSPKLGRASQPKPEVTETPKSLEILSKKPPRPQQIPSNHIQISPQEKVENAKDSIEKRTKVTLKRQFALDKAPPSTNLRESPSEESLNSINSVTQLLKIERNTFALNNNKKTKQNGIHDDENEEETITGVKQMAAKLEAKNANNLRHHHHHLDKNRNNENSSIPTRTIIDDNDDTTTFNSKKEKTSFQEEQSQLQSKEMKMSRPPTKAGITITESSSVLLKAAAAVVRSLPIERKKVSSNSSSSSKIASLSSTFTSSTSANCTEPQQEEKKESPTRSSKDKQRLSATISVPASGIRSRSNSPQKPPALSSPERKCSFSIDPSSSSSKERRSRSPTRRKSSIPSENKTRSPSAGSGSRKGSLGGGIFSATASSLAKQKQISRVKKNSEESTNQNQNQRKEWVTRTTTSTSNKSHLTNSTNNTDFRGQGQRKNDVAVAVEKPKKNANRISEKDHRHREDYDYDHTRRRSSNGNANVNTVPRYASPIRSTRNINTVTTSTTPIHSNEFTGRTTTTATTKSKNSTSSTTTKATENTTRNVQNSNWKFGSGSDVGRQNSKSICSNNKIVKESGSVSGTKQNLSTSSSASSSSSSLPSLRRSRRGIFQKDNNKIVIPTIIMSEYVDGDGDKDDGSGKGMRKQSQSTIFTPPVEFTKPLQKTCDIVEGSSLELKVGVKGAEYVVWVKEDKILPNAPPDIQYFREKFESETLYGLRIQDVFLEDAGIYICEAYDSEGSVITSWCEVDVIEAGTNEDDDDISWDDLDVIMAEEEKSQEPLVVPQIVMSQAEQDQDHETMTPHEEAHEQAAPEPESVIQVKQIDNDKNDFEENAQPADEPIPKSFAKSEEEDDDDVKSNKIDEREVSRNSCQNDEEEEVVTVVEEKRKLMSQLSSASDESIYLKEPHSRSGDEGALSATEAEDVSSHSNSTCININHNLNVTKNDGQIGVDEDLCRATTESPDPTVSSSSPCSEQNGRSSSVDSAIGMLGRPLFSDGKFPPRILVGPNNIIALYGEVVHLRVKVQNYGIPKTAVNWFKFINGTYKKIEHSSAGIDQNQTGDSQQQPHISITKCGTLNTLTITHINYDDCGRYRVKVQNVLGMDSLDCLLTVEGPPEPPTTPPKVKYDEKSKTILIQWSSCPYDGGSKLTGYYVEACIVHGSKTQINKEDQDNWQLLTPQSYSWLCYTLTEPKRGSIYRFRVFGENSYGKGKPTEPSLPLLVPAIMEGRRAGSSDALLWSLKSLSLEETSLRADSQRQNVVHEQYENESSNLEEAVSSQEEEPLEYKNVKIKKGTFYDIYDKFDELGKGRFGVVFEVVNKETKKSYAGKFVKCIKSKDKERVQLEVNIMNDLEYHPKLICLIDAFEMPREIIIVTQRIDGGELFERVVADDFTLTEGDCVTFLQQICDAVRYIHEKNIMHLDLKPENILCTSKNSNQIKIIDFGLAQYYDPKEPIRVLFGTAEFVSPEIINYEPIAPSTDNWSVGVITYILLSGLSPFMGDNDNETFSNITRAEFDFDDEAFEKISDDAKDFISNLIVKRPEKRMTMEQSLNHRWLKRDTITKSDVVLSTDKLKRFLVRRKWQKTGNAIRALGRITTLYSSRRSSSASSTPPGSLSLSLSSPPPPSPSPLTPSRSESLHTQDSMEYNDNVFFAHDSNSNSSSSTKTSTSPNSNLNNKINLKTGTRSPTVPKSSSSPRLTKSVQLCLSSSSSKDQPHPRLSKIPCTTTTSAAAQRSKYSDPCRSDSGVCDVGSFSSLGYES